MRPHGSPPPAAVVDWAGARGLGRVRWQRRLLGGAHARTDVLSTPDGREVVLRRFVAGDPAVAREVLVLSGLAGLGDLVPQLIAADADGRGAGVPCILTTLVPGEPATLVAGEPAAALVPLDLAAQLGRTLARIHAHRPAAELPVVFDAATLPATVRRAVGDPAGLAAAAAVLAHNDYWSGNTLWRDGRLTGVVDWSGAGLAPRGRDLAWLRLDLVLLEHGGEAAADASVVAYAARSECAVRDLDVETWDRYAAATADPIVEDWAENYAGVGRPDLDPRTLRRLLDCWRRRPGIGS